MVAVSPTIVSAISKPQYEHFTASGVNTNDTIPFADFLALTTIIGLKTLDGTALAFTMAGNVATLTTGAQVSIKIAGVVFGTQPQ